MDNGKKSVIAASFWMIAITLLLFFLPFVNGIIGGAVGGYMAGDVRRAMAAAILPAILAGIGLWVLLVFIGAPILGFFAGMAGGILVLLADLGIFLGALVGGWLGAEKRRPRGIPA
jgi:hypothetical protein